MAAPAITSPKDGPEKQLEQVAFPIHEKPWVVAFYRLLTALSAWMIIGLQVFKSNSKIIGYPVMMFFMLGVIIFCAKVRGAKVFGKTPVDLAFVLWLGLAVCSQLWASMVLNRVLMAD